MAKVKMTFTLDAETAACLRQASERLSRPQSAVVNEAIQDFSERVGRLSERERLRMLQVFDEVVAPLPSKSMARAKREIEDVRQARRSGGRGGRPAVPR